MVFGSEEKGLQELPLSSIDTATAFVHIPMESDIRSFNLSSSVAMGLFEALRQRKG